MYIDTLRPTTKRSFPMILEKFYLQGTIIMSDVIKYKMGTINLHSVKTIWKSNVSSKIDDKN